MDRETFPRPLRIFGLPLAGAVLVAVFIFLGFPYDELGNRIAAEIQRTQGVRIDFQDVRPSPHLAGPGIELTGVRATTASGDAYQIERAMLRPAWSMAWFRGDPAVYTEITSDVGAVEGTIVLGESGGWSGSVEQLALGKLPVPGLAELASVDGLVDGSVEIALGDQGPEGDVSFSARDGSITVIDFPLAIPFETLSGELRLGDDAFATVKRLDLEGPMIDAAVTGSVLRGPSVSEAPLRLEAEIRAMPEIRSSLESAGLRVDRNGNAKVRITGTVSQPNVR